METQVLNIVTNVKTNLEQKTENSEGTCGELFSEILLSESENKDKEENCIETGCLVNMLSAVYQINNDAPTTSACVDGSEKTAEIESVMPIKPGIAYAAEAAGGPNNSEEIIDEIKNALLPIENSEEQEAAKTLQYTDSDKSSDFDISLDEVTKKMQVVNNEPTENNSEMKTEDVVLDNPENIEPVLEHKNIQKNNNVKNAVNESALNVEIKKNVDKAGRKADFSKVAAGITFDKALKEFKTEIQNEDVPAEIIEDYSEFSKVQSESSDADFSSDNDENSTPFQLDTKKSAQVNDYVIENTTQAMDSISTKNSQIHEVNTADSNIKQFVNEVNDKIINSMTFTENELSQEFEIQIRPESLGKLLIKLQKNQDIMKVKIITTSPEVKEILSANTQLMQLQINDKGVELSNVEIIYQNLSGDENMQGREKTEQQNKRKNYKVKEDYNQYISSVDGNSVSNYININGSVSYLV